jgi:hypothetical protein
MTTGIVIGLLGHGHGVEVLPQALQPVPIRFFGVETLFARHPPRLDGTDLHRKLELPLVQLAKPVPKFVVVKLPLQVVVGVKQHVNQRASLSPLIGIREQLAETPAVVVAGRRHPDRRFRREALPPHWRCHDTKWQNEQERTDESSERSFCGLVHVFLSWLLRLTLSRGSCGG